LRRRILRPLGGIPVTIALLLLAGVVVTGLHFVVGSHPAEGVVAASSVPFAAPDRRG
jgi:hypothetical protein